MGGAFSTSESTARHPHLSQGRQCLRKATPVARQKIFTIGCPRIHFPAWNVPVSIRLMAAYGIRKGRLVREPSGSQAHPRQTSTLPAATGEETSLPVSLPPSFINFRAEVRAGLLLHDTHPSARRSLCPQHMAQAAQRTDRWLTGWRG